MTLLEMALVAAAAIVIFACGFFCGAARSNRKSELPLAPQPLQDELSPEQHFRQRIDDLK